MKKSAKILTAVVVVAAAYAGASWYVGKEAQATLQQLVEQANERLLKTLGPGLHESDVKLAISEYKRHVFSSDVIYTLQMRDGQGQRIEYLLSDHLQHGPFPLGALQSGSVAPLIAFSRAQLIPSAATQKWFDSLNGQPPITGTTQVGFSGKGGSVWQFKPLDLQNDGDSLKFSGGTVDVALSNGFQDSVVKGAFDALQYASARSGESLDVRGITLASTTVATDAAATVKTNSLAAADRFVLQPGQGAPVQLDKVDLSLNSTQHNKRLDIALQYQLGAIRIGDAGFGSLAAGFKGSNLDLDALAAMVAEYDQIKARHGVASDQDLVLTEEEAAVLRDRLWTVLDSQPVLAIDPFVWKNDKGESSLKLSVNLARPANPSASADAATLLSQMVKQLQLNVAISKPMFIQTFSQLQGGADRAAMAGAMLFDMYAGRLARAGLVTLDNGNAAASIGYQDDSVEVNGSKMPVAEFVQRVFSAAM